MSIRAGQILHRSNGFLIDRIQSGGPGSLNLNEEKIYELGNEQSVSIVRDVPDLSFDLESFDTSTEFEAILLNEDPTVTLDGDQFILSNAKPIDITSPYKNGYGVFTAVRGIGLPYLLLSSATYRFGVSQNATQSFTLAGDSIYYCAGGSPRFQSFAGNGTTGTYAFAVTPAIRTVEQGNDIFAYCVTVFYADGTYKRLFHGADYSDTNGGFALTDGALAPVGSEIHIIYSAGTSAEPQSQHPLDSVKPAAIRGRDIDVYVSDGAATPTLLRWNGVQSVETTLNLQRERELELGNPHVVAQDFDTPDVTGSITIRPNDAADLFDKIAQIAGVPSTETVNALSSVPLELEIHINHPSTGDRLKTLYVPDAKFTPPPTQGRVQTKLEVQMGFTSEGGVLEVYQGERP